jgi:hypothetical protein
MIDMSSGFQKRKRAAVQFPLQLRKCITLPDSSLLFSQRLQRPPPVDPTYFKTFELYEARKKAISDPTTLIIVIAKLIRMTGGNFRLLTRILTQIERVLDVNQLRTISTEVVEAARDGLVIGQG